MSSILCDSYQHKLISVIVLPEIFQHCLLQPVGIDVTYLNRNVEIIASGNGMRVKHSMFVRSQTSIFNQLWESELN